ncbi:sulfotransferase family protein [Halomonas denitrificans]|nr:sulfotransferase [Halomonas denitrificans]
MLGSPYRLPRTDVLPNFLIIGAAKSGTTSLYEQLRRHPQVCMPARRWKEPTFFSERAHGRWARGLDWYRSLFSHYRGEAAVGEASTSYTKAPVYGDAAGKIAETLPGVRLIYLVRDPVDQVISHYRHMVFHDGLRLPFDRALDEKPFLVDTARYAFQLAPYRRRFPRDRILVVPFERYVADPVAECREICRFLGIHDGLEIALDRPRNVGSARRLVRGMHWPRAYRAFQRLAPGPVRRAFDRRLTRPLPRPSRDSSAARRLRERLRSEVDVLEQDCGIDFRRWWRC